MKYLNISILTISLLLLSACSSKQESIEEIAPQPEITETPIPEEPNQEEETKEEELIKEVEQTVESLQDDSDYVVNSNQLYLENGLSRDYYETTPYLTLGEFITIENGGTIIGTVSFDRAEIIDDALGSSRKGLLLWFTETNTTNDTIDVGLYASQPLTLITVFKDDQELKPLSTTPYIMGVENNEYLGTYHLEYQESTQPVCTDAAKLFPGESRTCYQLYSYGGKGQYLINQATDESYEAFRSYILNIE